jgi:uncharacterized membrane protein
MSRRREKGISATWADAFGMVGSPSFGAIVVLGLFLLSIFLLWLGTAQVVYMITFGPEPPASIGAFATGVLTTGPGWVMTVLGMGLGFVFAVVVLRAVSANPRPMAVWGAIVAGSLVAGAIPLFLGLIIVMPVLGHATWHLYRKVVQ